jgi:nitrate/nitrite transport system permease protein
MTPPTPTDATSLKTDAVPRRSDAAVLGHAAALVRGREGVRVLVLPLFGFCAFFLLWTLYSLQPSAVLPGPWETLRSSWNLLRHPFFDNGPNDKGLGWHIGASLLRVGLGYLLAAALGVGMGLLVGLNASFHRALDPLFQMLRTIPPLAWLPIALAVFTQAQPAAVFVIFITAVWPILINTAVGVVRIPEDYRRVARVYQLRGWRYFWLVLLPASAPYIFTGLRIAIGMAWMAIVAAEMLSGGTGIGFFIWDSWNSSRMADIIVSVAYVGAVGWLLDRAVVGLAVRFGVRLEA